ncbi:AAA family ATPase [Streptosporangium sp. NPDC050280]|uniref:AAA family ATPase n=1 Tax=unclassified Streptosporangium TaxID=2632669 RepID=UPI00344A3581
MHRLALHGLPGAGKSTFARLLTKQLDAAGVTSTIVKVGAPLYELQALIHTVAGRPLLSPAVQDGLLLNDLAGHLRRINPTALTDLFAAKVATAAPATVMVCDDMRAPDVDALVALGFLLIEVHAPEDTRRARKQARGDLTTGDEEHPSEAPIGRVPYYRVANHGGLAALRAQAAFLIDQLAVKA